MNIANVYIDMHSRLVDFSKGEHSQGVGIVRGPGDVSHRKPENFRKFQKMLFYQIAQMFLKNIR